MTKEIRLTQGQVALVDDEWFDELSRYKWQANYDPKTKSFYATRMPSRLLGKRKTIWMHRVIINAGQGDEVDHKDGNSLNNRIENLRICTHKQNARNVGIRPSNISGYKGVVPSRNKNGWVAEIKVDGKQIYLKTWKTPEQAAVAYDEAAKKYFGEFARLNFPENQ